MDNIIIENNIKLTRKLRLKWKKLSHQSTMSCYFNSVDWFLTITKTFSYKKIIIVTIKKNNTLIGILPLISEKKLGFTFFKSPGGKFLDRSGLLLLEYEEKVLNALINHLRKMGRFQLSELPGSVIGSLNLKAIRVTEASVNYYLPLYKNFLQSMSNKNKKKILNLVKKDEKYLRFKSYLAEPAKLSIASKITSSSYKKMKKIESFNDLEEMKFFKTLFSNNKKSFLNVLYYKNKPISYEIGVLFDNVYYGLNKSFDIKYQKLNPGKITAYFLFKKLKNLGVVKVDFNRGADDFKRDFTKLCEKQFDIKYYKNCFLYMIDDKIQAVKSYIINHKWIYLIYRQAVSILSI